MANCSRARALILFGGVLCIAIAAQAADRACRMKTLLLVARGNGISDLVSNFNSDVKREHQVFPATATHLTKREGWRKNGRRNVEGRTGVVEIIRVNGSAVGQGGEAWMHFHLRTDDAAATAIRAERLDVLANERSGW